MNALYVNDLVRSLVPGTRLRVVFTQGCCATGAVDEAYLIRFFRFFALTARHFAENPAFEETFHLLTQSHQWYRLNREHTFRVKEGVPPEHVAFYARTIAPILEMAALRSDADDEYACRRTH